MKEIRLTKGYTAFVDDEDYDRVSKWSWYAKEFTRKDGTILVYAKRRFWNSETKTSKLRSLHHFILGITDSSQIDHKDRNGLNCRKDNLRRTTHSQNRMNSSKRSPSANYKGVGWFKASKLWRTRIKINGQEMTRYYDSQLRAAVEYDWMALKLFGEFAKPNFILCPLIIKNAQPTALPF